MMKRLVAAVLLALVVTGCGAGVTPKAMPAGSETKVAIPGHTVDLSPDDVMKRLGTEPRPMVLDVREDWEFKEGHIAGAVLIPLGTLSERLKELDPKAPVIVVCRSGNRSAQGADILMKAGFQSVYNMAGGMNQWTGKVEK